MWIRMQIRAQGDKPMRIHIWIQVRLQKHKKLSFYIKDRVYLKIGKKTGTVPEMAQLLFERQEARFIC
jgi:hypothetical protein